MARLFRTILLAGAIAFAAASASAQTPPLTSRPSAHDVAATLARLTAAIEKRGAKIVASVDHAGAAASVGLALRPTTVVIFGNPKLGTPLMQADQRAGLDLPLRVLVWQDEAGAVMVGYWSPDKMADSYGLAKQQDVLKTMAGALAAIADEAARP